MLAFHLDANGGMGVGRKLNKIQMNQAVPFSCLYGLWQEGDGTENPYLNIKS